MKKFFITLCLAVAALVAPVCVAEIGRTMTAARAVDAEFCLAPVRAARCAAEELSLNALAQTHPSVEFARCAETTDAVLAGIVTKPIFGLKQRRAAEKEIAEILGASRPDKEIYVTFDSDLIYLIGKYENDPAKIVELIDSAKKRRSAAKVPEYAEKIIEGLTDGRLELH